MPSSSWQISRACKKLSIGALMAYPTESTYGLGCDANCLDAVEKLLALKQRPVQKGLILLVSCWSQAEPYIQPLTQQQKQRLNQPSNRATTWLLPAKKQTSYLLCGQHTSIAIRKTQHPIAKILCQQLSSAIVSTSCNRANKPALNNVVQVRNQFKHQIDLILAGTTGGQPPSQIIDIKSGEQIR